MPIIAIQITFVAELYDHSMIDDCTNTGPACLGCPAFDQCPSHFDDEDSY